MYLGKVVSLSPATQTRPRRTGAETLTGIPFHPASPSLVVSAQALTRSSVTTIKVVMPGTTPDGLLGKFVGFVSLCAVIPVFALSLPLSFMFGTPSCWGFGEKYRPSFSYVW